MKEKLRDAWVITRPDGTEIKSTTRYTKKLCISDFETTHVKWADWVRAGYGIEKTKSY